MKSTQLFLTFSFALLLGFNNCKRVPAGQNLVCERRYDGLQVRPRNNNLIEKVVSEQTVYTFVSHLFFCIVAWFQETQAGGSKGGAKFGL